MSDTTTERAEAAAARARANRSPEQIEAEIEATRESLADDIDVLQDKLNPAHIAQVAKDKVFGVFRRPDGSVDPVRAAVAVGAVVVLVAYLVRRRKL